MKSVANSRGWRAPCEDVDVPDLDVTPIMNMFVILIPFLVSMAVFAHLAVLKFSLPSNIGADSPAHGERPKLKLTVVVAPDFWSLTHGERMLDSLPRPVNGGDEKFLAQRIAHFRQTLEIQDEVIVAVRDKVVFQDVVRVMDRCREAGFEKVGLSQATVKPNEGV